MPLFFPKIHIETIKQFRMDIFDTFGMTKRPLFESRQKIWTNFDCSLQKHRFPAVQALFDAVAGKQKVQEHLQVLLLLMYKAKKIPHSSRINTYPSLSHAPSGRFDQVHEEEGLCVAQKEQPRDVLEDLQYGESSKDFGLAGQASKYGENIGHFPSFVGLGSLISNVFCC